MGRDLIRWKDETGGGHQDSLFGVFGALGRREVASFPALRPHQREPWHAFCVQVAAMALIRSNTAELPDNDADWRTLLIGLTPDWPDGEAWSLVVDDWLKPALLQPPLMREENRADYRTRLPTPDALDMLVTSRNHDVKAERMIAARDEDWLFALVTLQTTEGYLGAGNFGVSRMNGGFASRMSFGIRPAGGLCAAFARDVGRLVEIAAERADWRMGVPLLWLEPWDGTIQLSFGKLDELYVEVCRRLRLSRTVGGLEAFAAGSKVARVAAAELKGKTGDPWAPIKADATASVTPTAAGFGYRQIAKLLRREDTLRPMLAETAASDDPEGLSIVASALVRGQGKTEGLHRRGVRLSQRAYRGLEPAVFLDRMGRVADERTKEAGETGRRLRRSLLTLVQGGPEKTRLDDDAGGKKVAPWLASFDLAVDREFFDDAFWDEVGSEAKPHRIIWRGRLREIALDIFREAAKAAPRSDMRRIRAKARAQNMLEAQLHLFVKEAGDDE